MQNLEGKADPERNAASRLGPWMALSLVVGSMLGVGIFIAPPQVAQLLPDSRWILALWLAGGVFALCGALSVAEPASMLPRSGGDYVYLRAAYGEPTAFAAGWLQILAIFPGSIAAMSVALAQYQLPVLLGESFFVDRTLAGLTVPTALLVAFAVVITLTALNQFRLRISGGVQLVLTGIPVVMFSLLGLAILVFGDAAPALPSPPASEPSGPFALGALATAYLAVYFAFSGWNAPIYVAGEVDRPGRTLPFALWVGPTLVTALYLVMCLGFLSVLSVDGLASSGEAGSAVAAALFGDVGLGIVTFLILLAILGSINGSIMTGARVPLAMAQEGDFPLGGSIRHPRYRSPVFALWFQAICSLLLICTGRIDQILAYTAGAMLITGVLTVIAPLVLRRRCPEQPRPFRIPLYPLPPLLYALSSLLVLGVTIAQGDPGVLVALAWFLGGLFIHRRLMNPASLPAGDESISSARNIP